LAIVFAVHRFSAAPHQQLCRCTGSWTQLELAEFRHIGSLIRKVGARAAIDYGLSDEGDPWCVICVDENVVAHFARIDGTYVGSWNGLTRARRDPQLRILVEQFSRAAKVRPNRF
jgi:hypothetical protein